MKTRSLFIILLALASMSANVFAVNNPAANITDLHEGVYISQDKFTSEFHFYVMDCGASIGFRLASIHLE